MMPVLSAQNRIHSAYNPVREASRFADSLNPAFHPFCIVVSEPGESFLAPVLRERFPGSILVALRYTRDQFAGSDHLWDAVWRPVSCGTVSAFLFNRIPDEYLAVTVFVAWKPSDRIWPEAAAQVWEGIAAVIRLQQSIMHTRSSFGRRWLTNMVRNISGARSVVSGVRTVRPVFLAAAGPSLERQFPIPRNTFYVVALSSSLSCLAAHGCIPDLCISTDGGYWAKMLFRDGIPSLPVAFPLEAAIPASVLERNPVVFLDYGSLLEREFFSRCGIRPERAFRNGTVTGTAAFYALEHTSGKVYVSGLDLAPTLSFSHARPHPSDGVTENGTDRLHTLQERIYIRNVDTSSLEIYAGWFASRDSTFRERFIRLAPEARPIDGLVVSELADITAGAGTPVAPVRPQSLPGLDVRKDALHDCLCVLRNSLEMGSPVNSLNTELMQMVSYLDYIHLVKKLHSKDADRDVGDLSASIIRDTGCFLDRLILMVEKNG